MAETDQKSSSETHGKNWERCQKKSEWVKFSLQFSPVWGNQSFNPGKADGAFKMWASRGLKMFRSLYTTSVRCFMFFEDRQGEFNLDKDTLLQVYPDQKLFNIKQVGLYKVAFFVKNALRSLFFFLTFPIFCYLTHQRI